MRSILAILFLALTTAAANAAATDRDAVIKANEQAKAENALIVKAMDALNAHKWQDAETMLLQIVALDPANWQVERSLGSAKFNLGKYEEAVAAFDKAIKLAEAAAKATPPDAGAKAELGSILTAQGNAYLKLKKTKEAMAAFEHAAAVDPHPATAYFNLCATAYNAGDVEK